MGRFVISFDTADEEVRHREAPGLLHTQGFSTDIYFPRLGIGVVEDEPERLEAFRGRCAAQQRPMQYFPELTYYAINAGADRDGGDSPGAGEFTWGLEAVQIRRAVQTGAAGAGVRVAVLDTGFDASHPDFADRSVVVESFITGQGPQDVHGHGTHCIGTACGPWHTAAGAAQSPGYGVASKAEIYSAKVLGDDGAGSDTSILAGIDWALQNDCQVISMSLGADVPQVHPPYVTAGRRALEQGAVMIAAAGNNAHRSAGDHGFVGAPANSPYVMAVAAVDEQLRIADFSARSLPHEGGEIDIAAPGVEIYSAWPTPQRYQSISGTSMAAPHVSGIAAVIAGASGLRGQELWDALISAAVPIQGAAAEDVGAGLAAVPANLVSESPTTGGSMAGVGVPGTGTAEAGTAAAGTAEPQHWVITVDDEHLSHIDDVVAQLQEAGLVVEKVLRSLGQITGYTEGTSVQSDEVSGTHRLSAVSGVASIDGAQRHSVAPPDAEVQ